MNDATSTLRNPTLWLVVGIPLATVLASILTVTLAFQGAEPELPVHFAREGAPLALDQQRAQRAQQLGVRIDLNLAASGHIVARIATSHSGIREPNSLTLRMTHATRAELDREVRLTRGEDGAFHARDAAVPAGAWLLQVDSSDAWRVRSRASLPSARITLGE